jgi:glycosyltransferase involved in cell wall biosynthesis
MVDILLLSIGMIVKNEEKYLHDCLTALVPILEQVQSELIIFDTGSTDDSVAIAREFTDKVYEIKWQNDFAWARNHTLDRARGKWYMFIDADEIFSDVDDIIAFFNSGEYKKYKSADYILEDHPPGKGNLFRTVRLFKREKTTRFTGKIHEYIAGQPPIKSLNARTVHHGYYVDHSDRESRKRQIKKRERNLVPLLELHEKDPNDIRTIHHIINELISQNPPKRAKEFIDKGLAVVGGNQHNVFYHIFMYDMSRYYETIMDDDGLEAMLADYFSNIQTPHIGLIHSYNQYAQVLLRQDKFQEAIDAQLKTWELFQAAKADRLNKDIGRFIQYRAALLEDAGEHLLQLVTTYATAARFDEALEWGAKHKEKTKETKNIALHAYSTYANHAVLDKQYADLCKILTHATQDHTQDRMEDAMDAIEKTITKDNKEDIARALISGDINNDYITLQKLRITGDAPTYFLQHTQAFTHHYADVILLAMQHGADFSAFLEKIVIASTPDFAKRILHTNEDAATQVARWISEHWHTEMSIKAARIVSDLSMASLLHAEDEDKTQHFDPSIRIRHIYLSTVMSPEVYNDTGATSLSEADAFTYFAAQALMIKDMGDTLNYIKMLRVAVKLYPAMKDVVRLVVEEYGHK